MKFCSKCKQDKPHTDFSPAKRAKDGFMPWCRVCCNEYQTERRNKMDRDERCLNDQDFGRWIRKHRLSVGLKLQDAEKLAKLPEYRLEDLENGRGFGINRREVVALSLVYKLDKGLIERKAVGEA